MPIERYIDTGYIDEGYFEELETGEHRATFTAHVADQVVVGADVADIAARALELADVTTFELGVKA